MSMHWVKWETVSNSRNNGGLGIGNVVNENCALLAKWLSRSSLEQNSLQHNIMKSKYGIQDNKWDTNVVTNGSN